MRRMYRKFIWVLILAMGLVACRVEEPKNFSIERRVLDQDYGDYRGVESRVDYEILEVQRRRASPDQKNRNTYQFHLVNGLVNEEVNKKKIEEVLKAILNSLDFDERIDEVYIFLNDHKALRGSGYSLGALVYKDGEIFDLRSFNKDWTKRPSQEDFQVYELVSGRELEGRLDEEENFSQVALELDMDPGEVRQAYQRVEVWIYMDI